jgi:hypothetical protein
MSVSTDLRGYNGLALHPRNDYRIRTTSGKQMKTYMVYPPNGYGFEVHAYNEMAAREQARFYMGVRKLPKGTEFFLY